jgi:hypothetical protein
VTRRKSRPALPGPYGCARCGSKVEMGESVWREWACESGREGVGEWGGKEGAVVVGPFEKFDVSKIEFYNGPI